MGKFNSIITKYSNTGVRIDNIEFAIDAVKNGTKREHILENLTASYRGMQDPQATALLEELFDANGGEFKIENRGGYLFGSLFLLLGLICSFFIFYALYTGESLRRPVIFIIGAIVGAGGAAIYFTKALRGKFRDTDEPFRE